MKVFDKINDGKFLFKLMKFSVPVIALAAGFFLTSPPSTNAPLSIPLTTRELSAAAEPWQTERAVNPSVEHIASWISAAGAGAALGDMDGDGLMNDLCLVDPRSDTVSVGTISAEMNISSHSVKKVLSNLDSSDSIAPMGCRLADFDSDGWTDVLVYYWGRPPSLFSNSGNWVFEATEIVPEEHQDRDWYTNTAHISDLNGDGLLDIFIGNYFADGTQLLDTQSRKRVSMHSSFSRAYNGGWNRILLQRREAPGEFALAKDVFQSKFGRGWTLAAASADLNGDSLPELFVANDFGPDQVFINHSTDGILRLEPRVPEGKGLMEPLSHVLGKDSFKGMGVSIADLNNDEDLDIVVSNITHRWGLFETQMLFINDSSDLSPLSFQNASEELSTARTAFSWDNKVADLNNDGSQEILQATGFVRGSIDRWPEVQEIALANDTLVENPDNWPNLVSGDISGDAPRVLLSRATVTDPFQNIAEASGLKDVGITRGIALADIDGDGDVDWVEANHFAASRLVINECQACGSFVGLRLLRVPGLQQAEGLDGLVPAQTVKGSAAIGAKVWLDLETGERRANFVDGGNGHSGQQSSDLHFGVANDSSDSHTAIIQWQDFEGNIKSITLEVYKKWQTILLPS